MPYKIFDIDGIGTVTIYKRRGNRSLRLTVPADGGVRVSIPLWTPYRAGLAFAMSRRAWIASQGGHVSELLVDGMTIGKTRRLTLVRDVETKTTKTSVRHNEIVVWYNPRLEPRDTDVQHAAQAACWRALKSESIALLTPRINTLAVKYGFSYRSLNIKRMKTRWGSCDQHGNIVFNLFLIQLPWDCIDYVILHELTHTRVLHHGPDFWQAMESILPGARRFKRSMRAFRPTLLPQALAVA